MVDEVIDVRPVEVCPICGEKPWQVAFCLNHTVDWLHSEERKCVDWTEVGDASYNEQVSLFVARIKGAGTTVAQ